MAISEDLRNELSDTVREIMREELGDFFDPSIENKGDESARITPKALEEVEFAFNSMSLKSMDRR